MTPPPTYPGYKYPRRDRVKIARNCYLSYRSKNYIFKKPLENGFKNSCFYRVNIVFKTKLFLNTGFLGGWTMTARGVNPQKRRNARQRLTPPRINLHYDPDCNNLVSNFSLKEIIVKMLIDFLVRACNFWISVFWQIN